MKKKDYRILEHILDYCEDISSSISRFGSDFSDFEDDIHYRHAVSMCVLQIGELANNLSDEYRDETKTLIPWKEIRGMRNILAHNYGESDTNTLWNTIIYDIPTVADFCKNQIEQYKKSINPSIPLEEIITNANARKASPKESSLGPKDTLEKH